MIRISTFERAKQAQGYTQPMQRDDGCIGCAHVSRLGTRMCMLGGFFTQPMGICDQYKRRAAAPVTPGTAPPTSLSERVAALPDGEGAALIERENPRRPLTVQALAELAYDGFQRQARS